MDTFLTVCTIQRNQIWFAKQTDVFNSLVNLMRTQVLSSLKRACLAVSREKLADAAIFWPDACIKQEGSQHGREKLSLCGEMLSIF